MKNKMLINYLNNNINENDQLFLIGHSRYFYLQTVQLLVNAWIEVNSSELEGSWAD